jgi:2',3'-cyclic-nucleotide 2'-phosphodiesterase (5'-nucleotidase family)
MSNRKRIISLAIVFSFALGALGAFARQTPVPPQKDRQALARKPAPSGTLADRLGEDDGYGLVLFYSADVHGNLEVCGCPIHPLGGVARRLGYINAFRRRSPEAATLLADVGNIFSDDLNEKGSDLRADARLMNDWIVRANELMPLDVVNLSYRDLRYGRTALDPQSSIRPLKSSLISANVKAGGGTRGAPAPYVIKTVTGARLKRPVRIALIGLTDLPPDDAKAGVAASGYTISDPLVAAREALDAVREEADVTVIVGYLKLSTANRLALRNDDIDVIIASDGRGLVPDPKQVNNALIVYASKETKHLGELRFYTDAEGVVDRFTARYVELDEVIPDDPELLAVTKRARSEIGALQARMAEEEAAALAARSTSGAPASIFVTAETCATCHREEYEIWRGSHHARAFAALDAKQRVYDPSCVGCHSVGFQQGGFINIKATPQFANVQCESCHGPGAEHVKMPVAGKYRTPATPAGCVVCHDRDNSPDFVYEKYWPIVAHGRKAR